MLRIGFFIISLLTKKLAINHILQALELHTVNLYILPSPTFPIQFFPVAQRSSSAAFIKRSAPPAKRSSSEALIIFSTSPLPCLSTSHSTMCFK